MYVEGYVVPVKSDRKADYLAMSQEVAAIYREYGATRVVEAWGEDVPPGKRTSFPMAVDLEPGETVVFGWMEYPDKATREDCHAKVWSDPRMNSMSRPDGIVDGARMIFGGFTIELDVS
jgi:uncharacterized protein YbaA (DUF1428 family)